MTSTSNNGIPEGFAKYPRSSAAVVGLTNGDTLRKSVCAHPAINNIVLLGTILHVERADISEQHVSGITLAKEYELVIRKRMNPRLKKT